MFTYLQRLVDERTSLTEIIMRLGDRAATENRDLTEPERSELARVQERCAEIDTQIGEHQGQVEAAASFSGLLDRIESHRGTVETRGARGGSGGGLATLQRTEVEAQGYGQRFIESAAYTEYRGVGTSQRMDVEDYLEQRAPITTSLLNIEPYRWVNKESVTTAPLLDAIGHVRVSSGVVEWVQVGGDPQAAVVPEGTPKPEAAFSMTPQSATLDTLAHWIQITRQALEDAPYVRSLIEGKLRRGLLNKAEADAAAAIAAAAVPGVGGATMLEGIRVGIGTVEAAGYRANGILMNPADYASLDVAVMGVTTDGPSRKVNYWGLPVYAAGALPAGTAYVGDLIAGVTLFDRGVTSVFMSDSHASLFISNILVILAETRLKTAVTEPQAMAKVTVTP